MANLGTLTLDLIAKIGGFTGPLDQASRNARNNSSDIAKSFAEMAGKVGAAIGAIPAVVAGFTVSTANSAKEITNLANLAGLGTTEFQRYAAGAKTVGIEQDKLSDIFKDTNDKLGDFYNTGGGELKDFFEVIAPKVGVTVEQFKKLNSADALQLFVSTLEKANVSQAEMTFYMEGIADEATALVPLLRNGGKEFKSLGDAAEAAGAILSTQTIAVSKEFSSELMTLGQNLEGAKNTLANDFMPVIAQFVADLNAATRAAGGTKTAVQQFSEALVDSTAFVVDAGDGVIRIFKIFSDTLIGMYATGGYYANKLVSGLAAATSQITFGETSAKFADESRKLAEEAATFFDVARQAADGIQTSLNTPLAGDQLKAYIAEARAVAVERERLFGGDGFSSQGGTGSGVDGKALEAAKKAAEAAKAAAKKIDDAYKNTETELRRQIELIDESSGARAKASEVAKLAFDIESGKLKDLNSVQKERLTDLAKELDTKKAIQKQNDENAKLEAFQNTLRDSNQGVRDNFALELAGTGRGDELKNRLRENLSIEQDYAKQRQELYKQFKEATLAGDPEAENRYNKETEMLSEALAERLVLQQDYYNQQDQLQNDWLSGVSAALENYRDVSTDYQQQAADATGSILGDATSDLSSSIEGLFTKTMTLGDAVLSLGTTLTGSVVKAIADMAAQWLVTQALQLSGISAITAATVASESTKAAAKVSADAIATTSSLTATATTTTAQVTAAATTTSAWLPAALVASIGSFGAAAVVGGAALIAAFALLNGFEKGGYTGDGASNAVAGLVHKGEFVFTKAETQAIGVGKLQAIANGYQDGGLVGSVGIPMPVRDTVSTRQASPSLESAMNNTVENKRGGVEINMIEDASRAGQRVERVDNDQRIIDLFVSNIMNDGETAEAMNAKYGLRTAGR